MTRQTITTEIDIPDGYEFVRIGKAILHDGYINKFGEVDVWLSEHESSGVYVILRQIWQPPSWMRPGWIARSYEGAWFWFCNEPSICGLSFHAAGDMCMIHRHGKPTVGDFTPPPCDDWRTSKRRIGGGK